MCISWITVNVKKEKLLKIPDLFCILLTTQLHNNKKHVAVVEMNDRDVTVPHVARSGEYEAVCSCYKCQGVVHLAMPTRTATLSLEPVTGSF